MRKLCLSLFHFNTQFIGNDPFAVQRYCSQAVIPFLESIASHPWLRVSFEMAGHCLQTLDKYFPDATVLLRHLIEKKQIELISATYTPAIWIAFPVRDLLRSIEINRSVLAELDLVAANIFFSQEGFFGPGIEAIGEHFSTALCKDDYVVAMSPREQVAPIYKLGSIKVIAGSNHLLNTLQACQASVPLRFQPVITNSRQRGSGDPAKDGRSQYCEWHWVHCGSGHHFCTGSSPYNSKLFFSDPQWIEANLCTLKELSERGFQSTFLSEFAALHQLEELPSFPDLPEGSWNSATSSGVYAWMGRHTNAWEDDSGVLGMAWRSRHELRQCERLAELLESSPDNELAPTLEDIWKQQLLAESSDPLGWIPSHAEVKSGFAHAWHTINLAKRYQLHYATKYICKERPKPFDLTPAVSRAASSPDPIPFVEIEICGDRTAAKWTQLADDIQLCEVEFFTHGQECGIRFSRSAFATLYSPSGLDKSLREVPALQEANGVYLPLANGLVTLAPQLSLIRINRMGQSAAFVSHISPWISFFIKSPAIGLAYHWAFVIFKGSSSKALLLAQEINDI